MEGLITPSEVLSYLNQLGYQDITSQQLKEFLYDLKRLIKYEHKQKREVQEHKQPTKENYISVQLKDQKYPERVLQGNIILDSLPPQKHIPQPSKKSKENGRHNHVLIQATLPLPPSSTNLSTKPFQVNNNFKKNKGKQTVAKSSSTKCVKSDPVALYHHYQEFWKKQKIPGEDNHSQLRWAVRKQLLGEHPSSCTFPSSDTVSRIRHRI